MRCLLGDRETLAPSEYADIVQEAIENIGRICPNVTVDKYVIMPNHIHMILVLMGSNCPDVSTIMRLMKRHVTISTGKSIWQRSFHDYVIRNEREYRKIWEYIESMNLEEVFGDKLVLAVIIITTVLLIICITGFLKKENELYTKNLWSKFYILEKYEERKLREEFMDGSYLD